MLTKIKNRILMKINRFLKKTILMLFLSVWGIALMAQERAIQGKVTDDSGMPLPGVTIVVKGTTNGTVTDVEGNYSINLPENVEVLVFSFIGMETEEVNVAGKMRVDVTMKSSVIGMDEVIVVGYGIQKKSDVISSVVSVKPESVNKVPSTDLGEMLKGKAAGVFVTLGDAGPGSSSNILIRGKNSINGGNDPIVIADGVPIGGINDINPNDIASIEILKDAAAQAIYGARASNGVILITTKRAKAGQATVNYSGYYGMQTVERNFDVYSGEEFAKLRREAFRADNGYYLPDEEIFTATELEVLESGEFIDWEDEVLRVAPIQNHNLSVATGNERTKVYSSINYMNQEGVVPGTDYQKGTIRFNFDQKVTDWLSFGANTSWQISENNDPGTGGTLQRTITTSPLGKIYNEDGSYKLNPTDVQESFNPLLDIETTSNLKQDRNDIMNIFIDVKPFDNFKYRLNASRRSWNSKTESYSTAESLNGVRRGEMGLGSIYFQDNVEWQFENIVTYDIEAGLHKLGLTGVQSITQSKYTDFRNNADNFPNDLLGIYGLESAEINTPTIGANERGLVSFVARAQYTFNDKYYLNLSARADASTVFGENNKWGYFPAAALGWNVYREPFIESVDAISNLKLRASYGSVGNEAISPYRSQSTANQNDYMFGGVKRTGYVPGSFLPNPDLRWETSTTLNMAVDFGLWRNRLSGTFEFYNTRTKDLLVTQSLNAGLGYTSMLTNLGEIENQGFEVSLNGVVVDKKDISINAGFSFSTNKNKIIHLYGTDEDGDGIEDDDVANQWFIGEPIDVYYQWMPVGIWQEGEDIVNSHQPDMEPGDIKLLDKNEDGVLNADDRVLTHADPEWYGSFNFDVKFKNFDFSADVMTVQGRVRWNNYNYDYNSGGSLRGIYNGIKQDYWLPENPTGNWPRPQESNDRTNIWTMALEDASYVRLQNVTIGYTLPKALLERIKLSNLRIYCTGHNLVTITDYKSYSPEKNASDYPEAVSVVGGVQLTF
jgi:TonB-linked SusC/RagA family outer membrane protein